MVFLLERGGNNIPLEVQRWQHFLHKLGFDEVGGVDGLFGRLTEEGTAKFQREQGVEDTGKLDTDTSAVAASRGYVLVPDDFYDDKRGVAFPPKPDPSELKSPDDEWRNENIGCFRFVQLAATFRDRPERIVIEGSCDDATADWEGLNIVRVPVPQLAGVPGAPANGVVRCHRVAALKIQELFQRWEAHGLMHLVLSWAGAFDPRYKKDQSPGPQPHAEKLSRDVRKLSNHAFGTAFDINAGENGFGVTPALVPRRGAVRELVAHANEVGFFWGGHFNSPKDGMHFELARL